MSRIAEKFQALKQQNRKGFIPYVTAGDPDLKTTAELILELDRRGADIIELGVPFSDPMADGPVIQRASERALRQRIGARECIEVARVVRKKSEIPIVLFSYLNPLLAVGLDSLAREIAAAGVDGVLATDMVPEEAGDYIARFREVGVDTVFLAAPTSTAERLKLVSESSSGFIYAVSRAGVTGVRQTLSEAASELVSRIREFSELPVAVGFGISTPEHVREVWRHADAAVVGSRIVAEIEERTGTPELVERVGDLTEWLISARASGSSS